MTQPKIKRKKKMKYNELFTPDKGIFATIFKPNYPVQYGVIFGQTIPQTYDVLASFKCGDKTLVDAVTIDTYKDIVSAVIAMNVDNWVKAANVMLKDYDALKPIKHEVTRQTNGNNNETVNDSTTNNSKAFNDTEFSPDSKGTSESTKSYTNAQTVVESVTGIGENKDTTDILQKEFAFRLEKWRESIIFAIVNEITLSVYE